LREALPRLRWHIGEDPALSAAGDDCSAEASGGEREIERESARERERTRASEREAKKKTREEIERERLTKAFNCGTFSYELCDLQRPL
jgi:hypothetical protein